MTDVLLAVVLLVLIATLAVAIRTLQGTRRSEALGEGRYELLRDQYEERQMLREELQQESQQRKQFMEFLDKTHPQLIEELERERQGYAESTRRAERRTERLEREHAERLRAQQEQAERLEREREQLTEELERERERRLQDQRRLEELEQEQKRLQQEEASSLKRVHPRNQGEHLEEALRPWWRRPVLVAVVGVVVLFVWLASLMVALSLLYP